jgi:hypothetical protein
LFRSQRIGWSAACGLLVGGLRPAGRRPAACWSAACGLLVGLRPAGRPAACGLLTCSPAACWSACGLLTCGLLVGLRKYFRQNEKIALLSIGAW